MNNGIVSPFCLSVVRAQQKRARGQSSTPALVWAAGTMLEVPCVVDAVDAVIRPTTNASASRATTATATRASRAVVAAERSVLAGAATVVMLICFSSRLGCLVDSPWEEDAPEEAPAASGGLLRLCGGDT
jgi:hypothetical protein